MGISRQAIYQRERRYAQRQATLEPVLAMVQDVRRRLPRVGTRKLYHLLKPRFEEAGIKLGRDGLFAYLRQHHLLVRPKRSYTKTTFSKHWMRKYPNLLEGRAVTRPEQVFVSDITYVESTEGVHYLSLVTDAGSRKIMGHELSREMKAGDVVKALQRAVRQRCGAEPLIHHSDRGLQYCSQIYQAELSKHGIKPSMTDGYDCYQNALAERVNGILKQEFLIYRCRSFEDMKALVAESIDAYNHLRPHLSLGMRTPEEVHKKTSCEMQLASLKPVNAF
jgi:transposase InsO family protein